MDQTQQSVPYPFKAAFLNTMLHTCGILAIKTYKIHNVQQPQTVENMIYFTCLEQPVQDVAFKISLNMLRVGQAFVLMRGGTRRPVYTATVYILFIGFVKY